VFITDPFITGPFVTEHVANGPVLNVYCSVDAKSRKHFAQHPLPRPALGTNRVCYECGLSPMPYPRSGVPETDCVLLADDYSISSKCRSNMCLKFLAAARRQQEMMAIIANAENVKSAEWQDEDISEMIIPEKGCTGSGMPVYTITEHFSSP